MDKKEFRVLIKYCFLKGKNKVEAQTWLDVEFPDTAPENQPSKIGYAKFKRGEISTDDSERSECPKKRPPIRTMVSVMALRTEHQLPIYVHPPRAEAGPLLGLVPFVLFASETSTCVRSTMSDYVPPVACGFYF
ncbi:hypothetical protein GWI33_006152 [Rhynchophorus ferrugineus]|uniref:Mos1 transposase HTH domain-containing protein n=1 Tax=Rhynchophorus ferrugineus TaxID=354439 RepID=A0A834IFH4_RHYFE|nr:hypothetical protein GWI33_006152 [Rhynchophorus ferrugineus]